MIWSPWNPFHIDLKIFFFVWGSTQPQIHFWNHFNSILFCPKTEYARFISLTSNKNCAKCNVVKRPPHTNQVRMNTLDGKKHPETRQVTRPQPHPFIYANSDNSYFRVRYQSNPFFTNSFLSAELPIYIPNGILRYFLAWFTELGSLPY